ncbi:MAG: gliding motility-associated C-terminal domain-containing protein, partial [Mucilaginibacter sp.]
TAVGHKGESIYYKEWSTATIDLSHYIGKTIRLEFTTNDCTRGQHFGYAYLDMSEDNGNAIAGNAYCLGQKSVTLYGPTGFSRYFWYNKDMSKQVGVGPSLRLSPPPPDNTGYTLVALPYDGVGCTDTLHTVVNAIDEGFKLVVPDIVKGCPGGGVDLTAPEITAGTSPQTTFGYFTDSLATSYLYTPKNVTLPGVYYIQGINKEGCMNILPVRVVIAYPEITVTDPEPVDFPVTVDLTETFVHDNDLRYSYYSNAEATKPVYNYTAVKYGGTYYVKAETSNGCQKIAKVNVVIHPPPPYTIVAPTAFTPNNDGVNDKFLVNLNGVATFNDVKIFNRYGKLVFSTKSTTGYWDGNFGGHILPAGVYYWILEGFDDYNQLKISKGGSIALIR